ncbi:I78 family peptidase inhibitor [Paracoccus sp. (in: a-proteobacteria)]|jgi:hypothetical protein|uniref:I78 family peptidase inhibitor n=1 Tax=Paracoccus sp. TaxID=267 RepID=UPI0035B42D27
MNKLLMLCVLGGLGACTLTPPAPANDDPKADSCGAAGFQGLVGQSDTALQNVKLPQDARIIGARDAVTMDYRPTRLNFEIGADNRIAKISCY